MEHSRGTRFYRWGTYLVYLVPPPCAATDPTTQVVAPELISAGFCMHVCRVEGWSINVKPWSKLRQQAFPGNGPAALRHHYEGTNRSGMKAITDLLETDDIGAYKLVRYRSKLPSVILKAIYFAFVHAHILYGIE